MKWTKRRVLLVAGLSVLAGSLMFCSPGYVLRAGVEEAKILGRRQPIEAVIAAPGTGDRTREKLELVRSARVFAERELGLDAGESYTTFSRVDSDTLLMVVSGSRRDAFQRVTWWFPIVGRVPYKGFFDPADAFAEARRLAAKGYDTYVRPSGAFSTLGWFNDPLLSTILRYDDVSLVSTVIHELTHNTVFIPSQVGFNESLASFVGDMGAAEYFCGVEGPDGPRCVRAREAWSDNVVFGDALQRLIGSLETLYARDDLSSEQKIEARGGVIDAWRARYRQDVVPRLHRSFRDFHELEINNAMLIAIRLYYDRLDVFERAYRRLGLPLDEAVARMIAVAEASADSPFEAIERLAAG